MRRVRGLGRDVADAAEGILADEGRKLAGRAVQVLRLDDEPDPSKGSGTSTTSSAAAAWTR